MSRAKHPFLNCMAALACGLLLAASPAVATAAADTVPPPPGIPAAPTPSTVPTQPATDAAGDAASGRSKEWQQALHDARRPDLGELVAPRPLAAIIGIVWFVLALRQRFRQRRPGRASR